MPVAVSAWAAGCFVWSVSRSSTDVTSEAIDSYVCELSIIVELEFESSGLEQVLIFSCEVFCEFAKAMRVAESRLCSAET